MSSLRLMFQNQWNWVNQTEAWEKLGLNCSSEVRMKGHTRVMKELMPDILGCQEVNANMYLDFKLNCDEENLPYATIWGHYTPIVYRHDKFELLDTEYLIYPLTYDGLNGEFNDVRSKSANLGVFRCKDDGKVFIFVTTHLWWQEGKDVSSRWYMEGSDLARRLQVALGIDLIDKYQKKYGNCPVFFGGDFNTEYDSEAIQYAINERGFCHAHDIATEFSHNGSGYNLCSPKPSKKWEWLDEPFEKAIDHILVRDCSGVNIKRFDRYTPEYYLYLSDHAPVYIDVEL